MARVIKKRMKLNRMIAGPSVKEIYGTVFEGNTEDDGISIIPGALSSEVWKDVYVAGQQGNILTSPSVTADSTLYNVGFFNRNYSVRHPDLVLNGVEIGVKPTNSDIMDIIQFGDYAFNMTNETTMGTSYSLSTNWAPYSYTLDKHEIAIYPTTGDLSGQLANGSDALSGVKSTISNISFNITQERPDMVYGYLVGNQIVLYVKDFISGSNTVYSPSGGIPNSLPFTYLLEQPLMHSISFGREGMVYGGVSGLGEFAYTPIISAGIDQTLYSPYAEEDEGFKIYYNPFKLKNMYNYNWNCEYDINRKMMTGIRDYLKVGRTQEHLWLSYKYYRETTSKVQEFDLVERVGGLYKYKQVEGHKSNIYSLRIFNSGLNEDLNNDDQQKEVQQNLRDIIEETVQNVVKKIAPASTQLWKIDWIGK